MLLEKQIQILVFKLDNDGNFDNIGEVNQFDSLIWPDKYNGYASFELWAPITEENTEYFRQGNILWCGGDNAAMIEIVKPAINEDGQKKYDIKGRTLEMLLTTRIVWGTYSAINKQVSTVMYELVNENCVNPTDVRRKIPFLELADDEMFGGNITCQKTGGEVYDTLFNLASNADIGFDVLFRPKEKKLIFKVTCGVDRTIGQDVVDPVEFSTELENILSSSYYTNNQDLKTVALVAGEDSESGRKKEISGNNGISGFGRRELYVDARDLQSELTDASGNTIVLSDEEYSNTLVQRGDEKLSACQIVESFEAQVRVVGNVQYEFGVDYKKGDKVTVRDEQLGVMVSARITEVEEDIDSKYSLVLTFGYSSLTILQKVKQQIT